MSESNAAGDGVEAVTNSITTTDGRLYIVRTDEGHEIYADQMAAIDAFGDRVSDLTNVAERDHVRELEIGEEGDDWVIRRLGWQDVAERLLETR